MLTLRCICVHSAAPVIRQSSRFRLQGKQLLDDDGSTVASLSASSVNWELHGHPRSSLDVEIQSLELEPDVSICMGHGSRLGPFAKAMIGGGAVRAGTEVLAHYNGDKKAWCDAPLERICDQIVFESHE